MNKIKLLLIEDNPSDARLLDIFLEEIFPGNFSLNAAKTLAEGLELLTAFDFDAILCDLALPDSYGLDTSDRVLKACKGAPVIVLTGYGDMEFGLKAVSHGAADFLNKNELNSQILRRSITYSIERSNLQWEVIAQVKAKEAAEQASRIRQEFLSMMSHEIRTPLNTIIGTIQLMMEENPSKGMQEHLNTLQFSSHNLLGLINNILDFSKIDAGKILLENVTFNFRNRINGIIDSFRHTAIEKNLNLELEIEKSIPDLLIGDPTRLTQVLNNLLHNAMKFTPHGEVRLNVRTVSIAEDKVELLFEVLDTGIGIEQNRLEEIFESYAQAQPSTTRQFGGTGLGLTICKKLITFMGGNIGVESEEGKGSRFYFTLSFGIEKKDKQPVADALRMKDFKLTGAKILLVEDNPTNRMLTEKFLLRWGADVDTADNGEMAVQKVKEKNFDLVLMDLQMPVMDGFQANQKIREMGITRDKMHIIALSAYAMDEDKQKVLDAGMDDFIAKPIDIKELYLKIVQNIPGKTFSVNGETLKNNSQDTAADEDSGGVVAGEKILSLSELLDSFDDDAFRVKYLDLLRKEFDELPGKINKTVKEHNPALFTAVVHKLSPAFPRLNETRLPDLLNKLQVHFFEEQKDGQAVESLLKEIKSRSAIIIESISEMKQQYA